MKVQHCIGVIRLDASICRRFRGESFRSDATVATLDHTRRSGEKGDWEAAHDCLIPTEERSM